MGGRSVSTSFNPFLATEDAGAGGAAGGANPFAAAGAAGAAVTAAAANPFATVSSADSAANPFAPTGDEGAGRTANPFAAVSTAVGAAAGDNNPFLAGPAAPQPPPPSARAHAARAPAATLAPTLSTAQGSSGGGGGGDGAVQAKGGGSAGSAGGGNGRGSDSKDSCGSSAPAPTTDYSTVGRLGLVKLCNARKLDAKGISKDASALRRLLRMVRPKQRTRTAPRVRAMCRLYMPIVALVPKGACSNRCLIDDGDVTVDVPTKADLGKQNNARLITTRPVLMPVACMLVC